MTENNPTNQNATQSGANAPAPSDANCAHNAPEAGRATVSEDQLAPRSYTTVFFDLDGTLLPIDTKTFMKGYMASIGRFMAEHGLDAEAGGEALFAGVMAMGQNDGSATNRDAFWKVFCERMGKSAEEWEPLFMDYYLNRFDEVGAGVEANPASAAAVRALKERGYRLAVTTMPMFPLVAVEARLGWRRLDPEDFALSPHMRTDLGQLGGVLRRSARACRRNRQRGAWRCNHNRDGGATKVGCDIYFGDRSPDRDRRRLGCVGNTRRNDGGVRSILRGTARRSIACPCLSFCEVLPAVR